MVAYVNADIGFTACVCTRMYAERLAPASWGAGELEELCICTLLVPEVPASKTTKLRTKRRRGASQQTTKDIDAGATANKEAQRCGMQTTSSARFVPAALMVPFPSLSNTRRPVAAIPYE